MRTRIQNLFTAVKLDVLKKTGHTPNIATVGWGEPPTMYSSCSCGWQGMTVRSKSYEALAEPFKEFVTAHGDDAILGADELYGDVTDSVRLILEHLELPMKELMLAQEERMVELIPRVLSGEGSAWPLALSEELQDVLKEYDWLTVVYKFIESTPVPERKTPFDSAVYGEYENLLKSRTGAGA